MNKEGSPNYAKGLKSDVKIVTTHPNGKSVKKYKEILKQRLENRGINRSLDESLNIVIQASNPEEIIKAVTYAGLRHEEAENEEKMLEILGKESDYALVINKTAGELALFVEGESYPLKPVQYERETEGQLQRQ